ncbi:UNVERIFIED_CONTAM: hypothetical protein K2H54_050649 [Gekko kuhli]
MLAQPVRSGILAKRDRRMHWPPPATPGPQRSCRRLPTLVEGRGRAHCPPPRRSVPVQARTRRRGRRHRSWVLPACPPTRVRPPTPAPAQPRGSTPPPFDGDPGDGGPPLECHQTPRRSPAQCNAQQQRGQGESPGPPTPPLAGRDGAAKARLVGLVPQGGLSLHGPRRPQLTCSPVCCRHAALSQAATARLPAAETCSTQCRIHLKTCHTHLLRCQPSAHLHLTFHQLQCYVHHNQGHGFCSRTSAGM